MPIVAELDHGEPVLCGDDARDRLARCESLVDQHLHDREMLRLLAERRELRLGNQAGRLEQVDDELAHQLRDRCGSGRALSAPEPPPRSRTAERTPQIAHVEGSEVGVEDVARRRRGRRRRRQARKGANGIASRRARAPWRASRTMLGTSARSSAIIIADRCRPAEQRADQKRELDVSHPHPARDRRAPRGRGSPPAPTAPSAHSGDGCVRPSSARARPRRRGARRGSGRCAARGRWPSPRRARRSDRGRRGLRG